MTSLRVCAAACALLLLAGDLSAAEGESIHFRGTGNSRTEVFNMKGPWLMTWHVVSDFPSTLAVEINLVEAGTNRNLGRVLKTKSTGSGYKLFHETGRLRFDVSSSFAEWRLKLEPISEEEAARMIPLDRFGQPIEKKSN